jgi:hypothetical protein
VDGPRRDDRVRAAKAAVEDRGVTAEGHGKMKGLVASAASDGPSSASRLGKGPLFWGDTMSGVFIGERPAHPLSNLGE